MCIVKVAFKMLTFMMVLLTFCQIGHSHTKSGFFEGQLAIYDSRLNSKFDGHFVAPNELHPEDLLPLLQRAPEGIHIAVGTERGFIGAALNLSATGLLLVDRDPMILKYNEINIALLVISQSRNHYLKLRLEMAFTQWVALANSLKVSNKISNAAYSVLTDKQSFHFFRSSLAKEGSTFAVFHDGAESRRFFINSNYLFNDELYARISTLAKQHRILAYQIDLTNSDSVVRLIQQLQNAGEKLSTFDLSNAWRAIYMAMEHLFSLFQITTKIAQQNSMLIVTDGASGGSFDQYDWRYFGVHFKDLMEIDSSDLQRYFWNIFSRHQQKAIFHGDVLCVKALNRKI